MTLLHRGWQASRNRTLNHFVVEGVILTPDERQPDGAYLVTTQTPLLKLDHQPLLPDVLLLRLSVTQDRRLPYNPPAHPHAHFARYYQTPIGADEDVCTKVYIRHNGDTLIELDIRDD